MAKYRIIYFNLMARAELARLILVQAGVEFEDVRVTQEEWAKMKPDTPFGQLPLLEVDGVQYCQSPAICSYLARKYNLLGKTPEETMRAEMIGFCMGDMMMKLPFTEKDEKKKEEAFKEAFTTVIPPLLQKLEALLKQNDGGDGYFVSQLSTADLAWMMSSHFLGKMCPDLLKTVPKLSALAKKIEDLPKISEWIKSRPQTPI
ncbi:hematopoietic prostaglandin D synthase-like [Styela clava]